MVTHAIIYRLQGDDVRVTWRPSDSSATETRIDERLRELYAFRCVQKSGLVITRRNFTFPTLTFLKDYRKMFLNSLTTSFGVIQYVNGVSPLDRF